MMSRVRRALAHVLTALGITAVTATALASVHEGVRVAPARVTYVQARPREWMEVASRALVQHDSPEMRAWYGRGVDDGRYVPVYREDDGSPTVGRRWVAGPSGDAAAGDHVPDPRDVVVVAVEKSTNVKTTVGIDFMFAQSYSTSPGANGLNYIALSNDTLTETSASTTLSTEIAANGLTRAQGTYAHTTGASTSTIAHTFTCATSSQSCQKGALFTASSSGTMNHANSFTQRTLQVGDTIAVTFTLTLS